MESYVSRLESKLEPLDAEGILEDVSGMLSSQSIREPWEWVAACRALCAVGQSTWWRCGCRMINPAAGNVDAICPKCGEMVRLPERLSRGIWGMYVRCLMQVKPGNWFDELGEWMAHRGLGKIEASSAGVEVLDGENVGVSRTAIADGGSGVSRTAIDARGAFPPDERRKIRCMDGMLIFDDGEVRGMQWISLEMMRV